MTAARASAETELVTFGVGHDDPARAIAGSPLHGRSFVHQRRSEFTEALDLNLRLTTCKVDVDAILAFLRLGNPEEQHVSDSTLVRCLQPNEVVALLDEFIASDVRPELAKRPWVGAVERHVED